MKKRFALFTILPCLAFTLFASTGCSKKENAEVSSLSFSNMYNYSAISSIHLLSESAPTGLNKKMAPLTEDEKNIMIDHLKMVDDMLSNQLIKSEETISDRTGFEKMYTISSTYLDSTESYTFYYSESKINDDDDDDFDWDRESNFRLDGLVVCDGVEYTMTGIKEIEDDESEISFKIQKDAQNYVVIEHESEMNEKSYEYTQYRNGVQVFETEMEYEYNTKKDRLEVEFEKETSSNKESYKYFYVTRNNQPYVEVIYTKNKEKSTYYIRIEKDPTTGIVNYVFEE